jgi:hypothetical protein
MTTDRKCVLSSSSSSPLFVSTIVVVVVINTFDYSLSDYSFSDDEYRCDSSREERKKITFFVCWLPPLLSFFEQTASSARARRFFSLFCGSFLETLTNLSFVYYYYCARVRVCLYGKSADTTTKAREWCLSAESSRRRNQ